MGLLEGRVAIVTGGASAIGRAIALRFAAEGAATVIVADLRAEPREGGRPTHELVSEAGSHGEFVTCDVTDTEQVAAAIAAADARGGVDVMVNNAGIMRAGPFLEVTEADYDLVMEVNAKAVFFASQAAARSMVTGSRPGVIINLSSTGGLHGAPGISAYCMAKGAVRLLSYALGCELGRHGIRVCNLHPGVIDTEMTRTDIAAVPADGSTGDYRIPLGRFGRPDDVAGAAVLLASDLAGFVTAASLTVDGGQLSIG